jgi:hypothetical protein
MPPLACLFATILKTKRSTRDRHGNDFRSTCLAEGPMKISRSAATMNGKFESSSNNYDESNLNRLYSFLAAETGSAGRMDASLMKPGRWLQARHDGVRRDGNVMPTSRGGWRCVLSRVVDGERTCSCRAVKAVPKHEPVCFRCRRVTIQSSTRGVCGAGVEANVITMQLRIDGALGKTKRGRGSRHIAVARAERARDEVTFRRLGQ